MAESALKKYRVMMKVEVDGPPENDPEVEKDVMASDPRDALDRARDLVRRENPEVNHSKIWFWTIRRIYERAS